MANGRIDTMRGRPKRQNRFVQALSPDIGTLIQMSGCRLLDGHRGELRRIVASGGGIWPRRFGSLHHRGHSRERGVLRMEGLDSPPPAGLFLAGVPFLPSL